MVPVLGYWSVRGLGQVPRYLLAHAGAEYTEKLYHIGPAPGYSKSEWWDVKQDSGLEFPNLPYYIDGDIKITESSAITKHLARKFGLVGTTEEESIRVDVAEGILSDISRAFKQLCFDSDFERKKVAYVDEIDIPLTKLSKLVGSSSYIVDEKITWVDFELFELLERILALAPDCLEMYANLQAFHKRVRELPNIKAYRASEDFIKIKKLFNGPVAKFGGGN